MAWDLVLAALFLGLWSTKITAQSVQLSERNSGSRTVNARIGETIEIAVNARLGRFSASGVSLYVGLSSRRLRGRSQRFAKHRGCHAVSTGPPLRGCSYRRQSGDGVESGSSRQPRRYPICSRNRPGGESGPNRIRHPRHVQAPLHRRDQRGENQCLQQSGFRVAVGIGD